MLNLTLNDILRHLPTMGVADLRTLNRECCELIRAEQAKIGRAFVPGQRVQFTDRRSGQLYKGRIRKINLQSITVVCDVGPGHPGLVYRVSPSLLKPEEVSAPQG